METTSSGGIISFIPLILILTILYFLLVKPLKNKSDRPVNIEDKTIKNPGVAAVLSFIIPGLGQIYNGEIFDGVRFIVINVIIVFFLIIGIHDHIPLLIAAMVLMQLIFYFFNVVDARKSAIRINKAIENSESKLKNLE